MKKILALDVGGTNIKSGLLGDDGSIQAMPMVAIDSTSGASADDIISGFAKAIRAADGKFDRLGICMPGPFDYNAGVSLMEHKFSSLFEINLAEKLISAMAELQNVEIRFCHDANAFLAGEMWMGKAKGTKRALGVTLGTGIGVACFADGDFLVDELGSPSSAVSVWDRKYKDGTSEDYVSTRALVKKYKCINASYDEKDGVKGIADKAKSGDENAIKIFDEFGEDIAGVLVDVIIENKPEVIVLGGQLSKSMSLFIDAVSKRLAANEVKVIGSDLGEAAALYGAAAVFFKQ